MTECPGTPLNFMPSKKPHSPQPSRSLASADQILPCGNSLILQRSNCPCMFRCLLNIKRHKFSQSSNLLAALSPWPFTMCFCTCCIFSDRYLTMRLNNLNSHFNNSLRARWLGRGQIVKWDWDPPTSGFIYLSSSACWASCKQEVSHGSIFLGLQELGDWTFCTFPTCALSSWHR